MIPVFPLNAHVFPEGRLSLRIFEARYLRMVRERAGRPDGFAMGMLVEGEAGGNVLNLATLVNIVDFDQLQDGLLGITVEGIELVRLSQMRTDADGLRWAQCEPVPIWVDGGANEDDGIKSALLRLLSEYPEIGALYPAAERRPLQWCLLRWLELLPIDAEAKAHILTRPSSEMAVALIHSIIDRSDPS
ncbi:LON peptidase substrate-binding domain-containing protein [Ferrimonas kyonanensis]|uniref:LON peptidase substrate-binding domain-containing protein n=1 Tax=Ferrimonas kyonanensis TaxID=364763 RepID=UPI000480A085|nr:LON peptidase substrate-binding domain-containing protein [Ferrimonas kyonanensis]